MREVTYRAQGNEYAVLHLGRHVGTVRRLGPRWAARSTDGREWPVVFGTRHEAAKRLVAAARNAA